MTFVVVLTGGICSGKSTVAQYFQEMGVPIIDADIIAKDLTAKQSECYQAIVEKFGASILLRDQSIDRAQLRTRIFQDPHAKQWLEQLLHPRILETIQQQIRLVEYPYCIVVIPLYTELQRMFGALADRVLVVDCPQEIQRARLSVRDHIDTKLITQMLASQSTREQRLLIADDVLDNQEDLDTLKKLTTTLHEQYLNRAKETVKP